MARWRRLFGCAIFAGLTACAASKAREGRVVRAEEAPVNAAAMCPGARNLEISISSVQLGRQCGTTRRSGQEKCSSLQLALSTRGSGVAIRPEIETVELLMDDVVIVELSAHAAAVWSDATSSYHDWDGLVTEPGEQKISYLLGGTDLEYDYAATFQVRVTMALGEGCEIRLTSPTAVITDADFET